MKNISSSSIFPKCLQIPSVGTLGSSVEKPTGSLWSLWCPQRLVVISSPHHRVTSHITLCVLNGINKHQKRGGLSIAILFPLQHRSHAAALPLSAQCRAPEAHSVAPQLPDPSRPGPVLAGHCQPPAVPGSPLRNTPSSTAFWPQPHFFAFRDWQQASHTASYLHI